MIAYGEALEVAAVALLASLVGAFGCYLGLTRHQPKRRGRKVSLAQRLTGLSRYRKTAVTAVGTVLTWACANYPSNPTIAQYGVPLVGLLTVLGVYGVPNSPPPGEPARPDVSEQEA